MQADFYSKACLERADESLSALPVSFSYKHIYQGVCDEDLIYVESCFDMKHLARMSPKRKREFLVGRLLSREVIKGSGGGAEFAQISDSRAPLWPDLILGSISHTDTWAVAIASNAEEVRRVGIDLESISAVARVDNIEGMICNDAELCVLSDMPRNHALALIFSAKETLFKSLFPEYGEYFDYLDAYVSDKQVGSICLSLSKDLGEIFKLGHTFKVNYIFDTEHVLTWQVDLC